MSNSKNPEINFGRKNDHYTNGGKPRPRCRIEGCEHPSQANSSLCPAHYREAENKRRSKLRKVQAEGNVPFVPLRGKQDLIVVLHEDGVTVGAFLYKPVRKLSPFEIKTIYGESPRKAKMSDGTLVLTAVDARRKK